MKHLSIFGTMLILFLCRLSDGIIYDRLARDPLFHKLRQKLIEALTSVNRALKVPHYPNISIPKHFDAREKWPECESLRVIVDQGACGSCWAVSSALMMSDRFCIASNGTMKFRFSAEELMTCCPFCSDDAFVTTCRTGGNAAKALVYWITNGVVSGGHLDSTGCKPYSNHSFYHARVKPCRQVCSNDNYPASYQQDKRFGKDPFYATSTNQIQKEVMTNGPVIILINATSHLLSSYQDDIYQHPPNASLESAEPHIVRIVGWGEERGVPYWIIANTWGPNWGKLGGFMKLLRGKNELGCENIAIFAKANLEATSATNCLFPNKLASVFNCDTLHINMKYTSTFCTLLVTFSCWSREGTALYQDAPHLNLPKNSFFYRLRVEYIEIIRSSRERSAPLPRSYPATVIPKNFDARERWPQCESLRNVANQGLCGSCWALSTSLLMTDRLCIASNGTDNFRFSAEELLTCCPSCNERRDSPITCENGGNAAKALIHWVRNGVVSGGSFQSEEGCKPYSKQSFKQGKISSCEKICTNSKYTVSYDHDKRYGEEVNFATDIEQIQLEIMTNGPVLTVINVTLDLVNFRGDGEWTNCTIIGWGEANGEPYWIIANTWGKDWGRSRGFLKLLKGRDELGAESIVIFAKPALGTSSSPNRFCAMEWSELLTRTPVILGGSNFS
ncbi:hypothetical protein MTP99_018590 [Tenebrio molitor]|nr:hypothetical protein MTP99_018590 [Tenebrio molitor]